MTFLAPSELPASFMSQLRPLLAGRVSRTANRKGFVDEDGARKALGTDAQLPVAMMVGQSLENLARIALG